MEKYDLVLDIIEHPERYSTEELKQLLADRETREIYRLLCKTESAVRTRAETDIEQEWQLFSTKIKRRSRTPFRIFGSRAATVAAVIGTSLVAVAAGITILQTINTRPSEEPVTATTKIVAAPAETGKSSGIVTDSVLTATEPIIFENKTLEEILKAVAKAYQVEIRFQSKEAAELHLYYKLDASLPIDDIVAQLNTFEQINIQRKDSVIIVD